MSKALARYLSRHAEPEAALAAGFPEKFSHVICVPAYNESDDFFLPWYDKHGPCKEDTLLILVINCPDNETEEVKARHIQQFHSIAEQHECMWQAGDGQLKFLQRDNRNILLVDRSSQPIPHKQGVGLARKIAGDIAVQLMHDGKIRYQWMFCTDGDVTLPENYFQQIPSHGDYSAFTFPFIHTGDENDPVHQATTLYEASIRYYVAQLGRAGSPYAINSIGSIICVQADAYAQVHGWPKRNGAEDFYLLNKLTKLKPVTELGDAVIRIKSRTSSRVPFGTGPAVRDLLECKSMLDEPMFYHPQIFGHIAGLVNRINKLDNPGDISTLDAKLLKEALAIQSYEQARNNILNNFSSADAQIRALHGWFDGFRTLKTVHYLRDAAYPDKSWREIADYITDNEILPAMYLPQGD